MARALKGLEDAIEMCIVDSHYHYEGPQQLIAFTTSDKVTGCSPDPIMNATYLRDLYHRACPQFAGLCSVPMLWDRTTGEIVNNESLDLMKIFNAEFNELAKYPQVDLFPGGKEVAIDEWCNCAIQEFMVLPKEAGQAETQEECILSSLMTEGVDEAKANLCKDALMNLDEHLSRRKFILDGITTAADIAVFNCVIRYFNALLMDYIIPSIDMILSMLYSSVSIMFM